MTVFHRRGICRLFLCVAAAVLTACGPGPESDTEYGSLEFANAWVRATPPGMRMTAAFGVLQNETGSELEITAWSSPAYGGVSLHITEIAEGVSKMREVPVLVIPAWESVTLAPGGYHLMLMMPLQDVEPGQSVVLQATTPDGRSFRLEAPVEAR